MPRGGEMWTRDGFRFVGVAAASLALVLSLSSCGDDESSTAPIVPPTSPTGWFAQFSNTSFALLSVRFVTPRTGVAVGVGGTIRRTTDGGNTWFMPVSGTSDRLNAVAFGDSLTGVIVGLGGSALRTSDGGVTWVKPDSMVRTVLNGAAFTSPTEVTAVGASARIFQSLDGGNTWKLRFSNSNSSRSLVSVSFGDPAPYVGPLHDAGIAVAAQRSFDPVMERADLPRVLRKDERHG